MLSPAAVEKFAELSSAWRNSETFIRSSEAAEQLEAVVNDLHSRPETAQGPFEPTCPHCDAAPVRYTMVIGEMEGNAALQILQMCCADCRRVLPVMLLPKGTFTGGPRIARPA